jgi:hypothetical protein
MIKTNMIGLTTEGLFLEIIERFAGVLPKAEVNKDIIFVPDELALRFRGERDRTTQGKAKNVEGKDEPVNKYRLEFINVWLEGAAFSWARQRTAVARTGMNVGYDNEEEKNAVTIFKAVPLDMRFYFSFWTKHKEQMDAFMQTFIFWQQDNPKVRLYYDEDKKLELDIAIEPEIDIDASRFINMFDKGKYWKHTFRMTVDSWLFEGVAVRTAKEIHIDTFISGDVILCSGDEVAEDENKVLSEVITE